MEKSNESQYKGRHDKYDKTRRKDTLISFRGSEGLKSDIEDEIKRLKITKKDFLLKIWEAYNQKSKK